MQPEVHILVVTLFEDDDSVFAALRAGARGYILKDADEEEMMRAIHAIGRGEAIFSPAVAARLMDLFRGNENGRGCRGFPRIDGA